MLPSHDDLLFRAQLLTGFHAILCLSEMVFSDKKAVHNYQKISLWHSVQLLAHQYSFFLPHHKGDCTFEGNTILIQKIATSTDPYSPFQDYLQPRDSLFPLHPKLWLTSLRHVPTHHWFIKHQQTFFPKSYTGHSLRSGGATSLAECFHHSGCWMVELLLLPDFHSEAPCCATCTHLWASSPPTCPLAFSYFSFPLIAELTSHISSPHFT